MLRDVRELPDASVLEWKLYNFRKGTREILLEYEAGYPRIERRSGYGDDGNRHGRYAYYLKNNLRQWNRNFTWFKKPPSLLSPKS
jgi:hypothetical protein